MQIRLPLYIQPAFNRAALQLMAPKPKKNKDDFQIPNKHRIKLDKIDRKDQLRNKSTLSRNLIESSENSDDEEYQEKLLNRGAEWWRKVNQRFFRQINSDQVASLGHRTSGPQLLQLKYPSKQLQNYLNEELFATNPFLASPSLLRVLFRREVKLERTEHNEVVTYVFKQYGQPSQNVATKTDPNLHVSSFRVPPQAHPNYPSELNFLDLKAIDVERNQEEVMRLLRYDAANYENDQINREMVLWEKELENLQGRNQENWQQMLLRRQQLLQLTPPPQNFSFEISEIRKELRMNEVLLYFKRGHGDKTDEMLDQALEIATIREMSMKEQQRKKRGTKMQQLKNLFETDCKICFCTESDDKNRVVYCDECNTSFHQACYGVEHLGEGKYFCEVCQFLKGLALQEREGQRAPRKPSCQICCKLNFPMRQLKGHFYHVTCLVLFDLVEITNYQLEFKRLFSHQGLMLKVLENQLQSGHCKYCLKETGMKFGCAFQGCGCYYHPICGYLNGVRFELKRSFRSISAQLTCPEHHESHRNSLNQIYLRRFFCDYNGTSKMNDSEFQAAYKEERAKRLANAELKVREKQLILRKGKLLKNAKVSQSKERKVSKQRSDGALSKKESESFQNSGVAAEVDVSTETRKLIRIFSQSGRGASQ